MYRKSRMELASWYHRWAIQKEAYQRQHQRTIHKMPKWPIGIVPMAVPTIAKCRDTQGKSLPAYSPIYKKSNLSLWFILLDCQIDLDKSLENAN